MAKTCETQTLNQDQPELLCPGVEVLARSVEAHFGAMRRDIKDTVESAFKVQLEQSTGFSWDERGKLKCILGWAKRAKDDDNRVKAWVWGVGASLASITITWFAKGLIP